MWYKNFWTVIIKYVLQLITSPLQSPAEVLSFNLLCGVDFVFLLGGGVFSGFYSLVPDLTKKCCKLMTPEGSYLHVFTLAFRHCGKTGLV